MKYFIGDCNYLFQDSGDTFIQEPKFAQWLYTLIAKNKMPTPTQIFTKAKALKLELESR